MTDMQVKMQSNKIAAKQAEETARSNRAKEQETKRSNLANERETKRSNKVKESQGWVKSGLQGAESAAKRLGKAAKFMTNDPKFYLEGNEDLIASMVPQNFGNPLGNFTNAGEQFGSAWANHYDSTLHPAVMVLKYQNSIGHADGTNNDVPNRVANLIFTKIQEETNYTKSYQPSDVMMMILAEREIVGLASHIAKVLRLAKTHAFENTAYPKSIIEAVGINYTDLVNNYDSYLKKFELLLTRLSQLRIPNINLMYRAMQMGLGWYKDSNVPHEKVQTYIFRPASYGTFGYNSSTSVGEIKFTAVADGDTTTTYLSNYLTYLSNMIDAILKSSDFKFISGDLGRITDDFFDLKQIDAESEIYPIYDVYTLDQIHNIRLLPAETSLDVTSCTISQMSDGAGLIKCQPILTATTASQATFEPHNGYYINLSDDNPVSVASVIDASRFNYKISAVGTDKGAQFTEFGTEIICGCKIVCVDYNNNLQNVICSGRKYGPENTASDGWASILDQLALSRNFKHCPLFVVALNYSSAANTVVVYDFDNYRWFHDADFVFMNEAALYGLFGVNTVFKI